MRAFTILEIGTNEIVVRLTIGDCHYDLFHSFAIPVFDHSDKTPEGEVQVLTSPKYYAHISACPARTLSVLVEVESE